VDIDVQIADEKSKGANPAAAAAEATKR